MHKKYILLAKKSKYIHSKLQVQGVLLREEIFSINNLENCLCFVLNRKDCSNIL